MLARTSIDWERDIRDRPNATLYQLISQYERNFPEIADWTARRLDYEFSHSDTITPDHCLELETLAEFRYNYEVSESVSGCYRRVYQDWHQYENSQSLAYIANRIELDTLGEADTDIDLLKRLVVTHLSVQDGDGAKAAALELLNRVPNSVQAHLGLARAYRLIGEFDLALEGFAMALSLVGELEDGYSLYLSESQATEEEKARVGDERIRQRRENKLLATAARPKDLPKWQGVASDTRAQDSGEAIIVNGWNFRWGLTFEPRDLSQKKFLSVVATEFPAATVCGPLQGRVHLSYNATGNYQLDERTSLASGVELHSLECLRNVLANVVSTAGSGYVRFSIGQ